MRKAEVLGLRREEAPIAPGPITITGKGDKQRRNVRGPLTRCIYLLMAILGLAPAGLFFGHSVAEERKSPSPC
jgi:hypothetical protein